MHIFLRNSLLPFLALVICLPLVFSSCPVIFNFGDANSDTGAFAAAMGVDATYPYGRIFSIGSTSRATDGRLVIDFLCEHFGIKYLSPYLDSLDRPDFSNGANFAVLGAHAQKPNTSELTPFDLKIQVQQFTHFHNQYDERNNSTPKKKFFKNALYTIDIGKNDLSDSFCALSLEQVTEKIPSFISRIEEAILAIGDLGGNNFLVQSTEPLGCSPRELAIRRNSTKSGDRDHYGCLKSLNNGAKEFNTQLKNLCKKLGPKYKIVFVDVYSIKYDLIKNPTSYGFKNPLMACCGYGGSPYNFDPKYNKTCWTSEFTVCNKEEHYINWDGVHYTEAANAIIASKIVSNKYSTSQLDDFCSH